MVLMRTYKSIFLVAFTTALLLFVSIFEITATAATTTTESPYTAGGTQSSSSGSGYSFLQSVLKVKQDVILKGVEQYITDITSDKRYWAIVIDAGTSKPSSTNVGTVVAKELGKTSSSTTGWIGTTNKLDVRLHKDHWYIIGIAIDSSATRKWYYNYPVSTATDFTWAEFHPGSYFDSNNPPDSVFSGAYKDIKVMVYTRFYLERDTTPPSTTLSSVAGDTSSPYWDNMNDAKTDIIISGEAGMSCRWATDDVGYSSATNDCTVIKSAATCSLNLLEGSYIRYISCKDWVGNEQNNNQNLDVTFNVDWTKPNVNTDYPAASTWFRNDFSLQYDVTDTNIDSCSISTKDGSASWIQRSTTCGTDNILTVTVGSSKFCTIEGTDKCGVKVYGKDKAGNENEVTRSFSIDTTQPTIDLIQHSPIKGITPDTDVTIKVEASDASSGLSEIKIFVDDSNTPKRTCISSPCLYTSKYSTGTHNYNAKVIDRVVNEKSSEQFSFKVVVPTILQVKKGWNLVSIPYKIFDFISSNCDPGRSFYNYDITTKTWSIVKNAGGIEAGKGYWVYSDKICEVKIIKEEELLHNEIELKTGWNHIGSPDNSVDFNAIKGGCTLETILYYDTLIGNWKTVSQNDKLEPFKAYFIRATC